MTGWPKQQQLCTLFRWHGVAKRREVASCCPLGGHAHLSPTRRAMLRSQSSCWNSILDDPIIHLDAGWNLFSSRSSFNVAPSFLCSLTKRFCRCGRLFDGHHRAVCWGFSLENSCKSVQRGRAAWPRTFVQDMDLRVPSACDN